MMLVLLFWVAALTLSLAHQQHHIIVDVDIPKTGTANRRELLKNRCFEIARTGASLPNYTIVSKGSCSVSVADGLPFFISPHYEYHTGISLLDKAVDSLIQKIPNASVTYIATLREPEQRVVSEWAELAIGKDVWASLSPEMKLHGGVQSLRKNMTFFLEHKHCPAHNRQTWMLAQDAEVVSRAFYNYISAVDSRKKSLPFDEAKFYSVYRWYYNGSDDFVANLNNDDSLLARAKARLADKARPFVLGVTEQMDEFWNRFDRTFGHAPIYFSRGTGKVNGTAYASKRFSRHSHALSRTAYQKVANASWLKARNRLDDQLYKHVLMQLKLSDV